MRLLLILLVVIGVLVVLAIRAAARGRKASADEQRTIVQPDPSPAGSDRPATRADGRPIPGSEEDRHRHGKP